MTNAARVVLQDCQRVLSRHSRELSGEDFRVSWVSVVALLRAVGHVLHKVDRLQSPRLAAAIDAKWTQLKRTKPAPAIYWKLIEEERNNVLKLYRFGVTRGLNLDGPELDGRSTYVTVDYVSSRGGTESQPASFSFISSGEFAGRDEREIAREACAWWQATLDEIDAAAQQGDEADKA